MKQYIDKSTLVAEIERITDEQQEICKADVALGKAPDSKNIEVIYQFQQFTKFLDTLEVKEIGVYIGPPEGDYNSKTVQFIDADGNIKEITFNKAQNGKSALEAIKEKKIDNQNCVKPADKVEPKFREGDWVVYCNDDVDLITGIEENGYCINNGGYIPFICENEMRLWDITDAKVGDVLVSESTCGLGTWYCIFKSLDGDESMTVYCYLARDGRFETKKEQCFDKDPYNTKPATKEQRDTLMKAMADAGYTFDFEKKELKKIEQTSANETPYPETLEKAIDLYYNSYGNGEGEFEHLSLEKFRDIVHTFVSDYGQKPAWSEEDERMCQETIDWFEKKCFPYALEHENPARANIKWLKSLKDRVQPQQKQEWSENQWTMQDEEELDIAIKTLEEAGQYSSANWLKNVCLVPQPKQEWSEEDEQYLLVCKNALAKYQTTDKWDAYIISRWLENKLKSLRPQNHWKPSDEHYELEEFAKIVRSNLTGISKAVQKLFEAKYLQLTGNKMYGGFKD